MEKMLRELTDQLYKYNAFLENKVLKSEDIEEKEVWHLQPFKKN